MSGFNVAVTMSWDCDVWPAALSACWTVCEPAVQVVVATGRGAAVPIPTAGPYVTPSADVLAVNVIEVPTGVLLCQVKKFHEGLRPAEQVAVKLTTNGAVLYVQEPGSHVGKRSEHLVVRKDGREINKVPMHAVRQVVVCGNVQVSTQALETLAANDIPVMYLTGYGRFVGAFMPAMPKNVGLREAQFRHFADGAECLKLAKAVVRAKLTNQRTLLMRSLRSGGDRGSEEPAARGMADLLRKLDDAESLESVLGREGQGAALYFGEFNRFLKAQPPGQGFDFTVRNRRPPRDPVNALLSFAYAMLAKDCFSAVCTVGVRPLQGFLPLEQARQAVAGPGPVGGVPRRHRRQRRVDAHQQRDADAEGLPGLEGGVPPDGRGPQDVLPRLRDAQDDRGDAPGVRLQDVLRADAGGAGADARLVCAGRHPGVHRVHGALMESFLVCYDISDPKRLRKVAATCEDFGYRKQFSVFLCRLSATDFVRLRNRLYDLIKLDEDQVLLIPLCPKCVGAIEALGRPTEPPEARDVVLVI